MIQHVCSLHTPFRATRFFALTRLADEGECLFNRKLSLAKTSSHPLFKPKPSQIMMCYRQAKATPQKDEEALLCSTQLKSTITWQKCDAFAGFTARNKWMCTWKTRRLYRLIVERHIGETLSWRHDSTESLNLNTGNYSERIWNSIRAFNQQEFLSIENPFVLESTPSNCFSIANIPDANANSIQLFVEKITLDDSPNPFRTFSAKQFCFRCKVNFELAR